MTYQNTKSKDKSRKKEKKKRRKGEKIYKRGGNRLITEKNCRNLTNTCAIRMGIGRCFLVGASMTVARRRGVRSGGRGGVGIRSGVRGGIRFRVRGCRERRLTFIIQCAKLCDGIVK